MEPVTYSLHILFNWWVWLTLIGWAILWLRGDKRTDND